MSLEYFPFFSGSKAKSEGLDSNAKSEGLDSIAKSEGLDSIAKPEGLDSIAKSEGLDSILIIFLVSTRWCMETRITG